MPASDRTRNPHRLHHSDRRRDDVNAERCQMVKVPSLLSTTHFPQLSGGAGQTGRQTDNPARQPGPISRQSASHGDTTYGRRLDVTRDDLSYPPDARQAPVTTPRAQVPPSVPAYQYPCPTHLPHTSMLNPGIPPFNFPSLNVHPRNYPTPYHQYPHQSAHSTTHPYSNWWPGPPHCW